MFRNLLLAVIGLSITACSGGNSTKAGPVIFQLSEEDFSNTGCNPHCRNLISTQRAKIVGIEQNEIRYVLARVQGEYASPSWQTNLQGCLVHWSSFQTAERFTLIPAALLAGQAYVESYGCKMMNSSDGGHGPMQITSPDNSHIQAVATMLHIRKDEVRWQDNYLHNVLLGAVMLSAYEDTFLSRGVGVLAYNSGPGAAKKYMRRAGLFEFTGKHLSDFRGTVPEGFNDGARPRIYLDRVLAGAALVWRAKNRQPTTQIKSLGLHDIPGSQPSEDVKP